MGETCVCKTLKFRFKFFLKKKKKDNINVLKIPAQIGESCYSIESSIQFFLPYYAWQNQTQNTANFLPRKWHNARQD